MFEIKNENVKQTFKEQPALRSKRSPHVKTVIK